MTKTFTFKTKNNNGFTFPSNNRDTDYSKILDNIIAADVINKNKYLFDTEIPTLSDADIFTSLIDEKPIILNGSNLKKLHLKVNPNDCTAGSQVFWGSGTDSQYEVEVSCKYLNVFKTKVFTS